MSTVADAFGDAARDARAAWHGEQTALAVLVALAAALPWFGPDWVHIDVLAAWLYLALSATGLALTAGLAGLPSLAQGAFMSVGSFAGTSASPSKVKRYTPDAELAYSAPL